jgi:hypothetical protein
MANRNGRAGGLIVPMQLFALLLSIHTFAASIPGNDILSPSDGTFSTDTRPSVDPFIIHTGDLSIPRPTRLSWRIPGDCTDQVYDIYLAEDSLLDSTDRIATGYTDTVFDVWNLKIGTRYFWRIVVSENGRTVHETARFSFTTPLHWPRTIYLDGATNVRDIGGRRTMDGCMIRQGLLYRSSEFNQNHIITAQGVRQLMDLGIVCEIDLRQDYENPQAVLPPSVRYFHPASEFGGLLAYQFGLQNYAAQYRDVFREMAKPANYPMVEHCRAGADRAGTIAALLEALLGCSEEQMAADYEWSSLSVYGVRTRTSAEWTGLVAEIKSFDTASNTVGVGAWNYLHAQGLSVEELTAIRNIFLDTTRVAGAFIVTDPVKRPERPSSTGAAQYITIQDRPLRMGHNIQRLILFDLAGRKIWEFARTNSIGEIQAIVPQKYAGAGVLYSIKR